MNIQEFFLGRYYEFRYRLSVKKKIQFVEDKIGYVSQVIIDYVNLSGGLHLNAAVTWALRLDPNPLLLNAPTNHLDIHNRKTLMFILNMITVNSSN